MGKLIYSFQSLLHIYLDMYRRIHGILLHMIPKFHTSHTFVLQFTSATANAE